MNELPKDVVQHILEYVDDENLFAVCVSSSKLAQICSDDEFWIRRIAYKFNIPRTEYVSDNFKKYYSELSNIVSKYSTLSNFEKLKRLEELADTKRCDLLSSVFYIFPPAFLKTFSSTRSLDIKLVKNCRDIYWTWRCSSSRITNLSRGNRCIQKSRCDCVRSADQRKRNTDG